MLIVNTNYEEKREKNINSSSNIETANSQSLVMQNMQLKQVIKDHSTLIENLQNQFEELQR